MPTVEKQQQSSTFQIELHCQILENIAGSQHQQCTVGTVRKQPKCVQKWWKEPNLANGWKTTAKQHIPIRPAIPDIREHSRQSAPAAVRTQPKYVKHVQTYFLVNLILRTAYIQSLHFWFNVKAHNFLLHLCSKINHLKSHMKYEWHAKIQ